MFEKNKFQKYMFVNKYYKRTLVVLILANLQEFPKKNRNNIPPPPHKTPAILYVITNIIGMLIIHMMINVYEHKALPLKLKL